MLTFFLSTVLAFQSASLTPQNPRGDVCEVYLVDVKTAQRIFERYLSEGDLEQKVNRLGPEGPSLSRVPTTPS